MRPYADRPEVRARQIGADVGMLGWTIGWVLAARAAADAAQQLAGPGRAVEDLGASVAESMSSAAEVAQDVPLVGDQLADPLDALGEAASSVSGVGQAAQDAVGTLATLLAVLLVVLPVGWMLLRWLPWRLRWMREAEAVRRMLRDTPDLELLAARALAGASLSRLAELPAGTGAAWRAGDPAVVRTLAWVELVRLGLQVPEPDREGPDGQGPDRNGPEATRRP